MPFCHVLSVVLRFSHLVIVFDHPHHKAYQPLWHISITKPNRLWRQGCSTIHQNQQLLYFPVTMMTVMTIPLGYPFAWGYTKISVVIVMTVIFIDKATGRPRAMRLPCCFILWFLAYCFPVSNIFCSCSQAIASTGCSIVWYTGTSLSFQIHDASDGRDAGDGCDGIPPV